MLYLDYAASTPLCAESMEEIQSAMQRYYGNPSAVHYFGRASSVYIEQARMTVADCLHCQPTHIVFTSSATEAVNLAIRNICLHHKPQSLITSALEHYSVLKSAQQTADQLGLAFHLVAHDASGAIDLQHLDTLLSRHAHALVCLAHANNEIGNLLPVHETGELCHKHKALFFCDTVQTMGKYDLDLTSMPVDFAVGSAHKFYGPKGTGILYAKNHFAPLLVGCSLERNRRAGTENLYGIGGTAAALKVCMNRLSSDMRNVQNVKQYGIDQLVEHFPDVVFVGTCEYGGLYNLMNFYLPDVDMDMLRIRLDVAGIAVSGGSACSSGSEEISHVIQALDIHTKTVRVSLGRETKESEMDFLIHTLVSLTQE